MALFVSYVLNTAGITQHEFDWRVIDCPTPTCKEEIAALQSSLKQTICGERDRACIERRGNSAHVYGLTVLNWREIGAG